MRTSALIITSCDGRNDRHCLYPSTQIFYGETTRVRNMKIVDAQYEDLKEILALQREAFAREAEAFNNWAIDLMGQPSRRRQSGG